MKLIPLTFKKLGNHWYPDLAHDDPNDIKLDPKMERYINRLDTNNEGIITSIYLMEQTDTIVDEGLIQFTDKDLLRYFTTNDDFIMTIYIQNHKFRISSKLYSLLEAKYQLDFHLLVYRVTIF